MTEANPAPALPKTATVTLQRPIRRGDLVITEVMLREPLGGDLRGLNVQQLNQSDYNAIRTLVPRIAMPQILESDFDGMSAADVAAFAGEVLGFFMSPAQMAAIEEYFGVKTQQSLTG